MNKPIEVVGLKELLEEVSKADAALSAGDTHVALKKVRTASAVASLIKSHVANRPLFRSPQPDLVAEIERTPALMELGKRLAARLDEDDWSYIEPFLLAVESGSHQQIKELRQQLSEAKRAKGWFVHLLERALIALRKEQQK